MDPDSFMSSYQFVNSLASCYPQSQLAQQQQQQHNQHPAASNQAANDYFANPTYNPNLYSAPHYANQNYLATQQQQQQQQGGTTSADMVDYTQLQPQRMMLGGGGGSGGNSAVAAASLPNPQNAQQPGGHAVTGSTNSCKYAAGDSATNLGTVVPGVGVGNTTTAGPIASPQDLSTGRELISPKLSPNSVVENVARTLGKGASTQQMLNNNNNNKNINSNHTTNVSLHSPTGDSETSSDSGAEDGDNGGGAGGRSGRGSSSGNSTKKGSGPPEIYPWMKRVHLGQSEWKLALQTSIFHRSTIEWPLEFILQWLLKGWPSSFHFASQIGRTILAFSQNYN